MFARFAADDRGVVGIIFGLALLPVVGLTGAAVDYTRASGVRAHMQSAMDAAVLAGASAPKDTGISVAEKVFANNFTAPAGGTYSVSPVFTRPTADTFKGTSTLKNPNVFMSILGMRDIAVGVTSVARTPATTTSDSNAGKVCILLLAPNQNQALLVNSGPNITAPKCQIDVKSTASPAAIFNSGATLNFKKICVAGNSVIQNGGAVPNLETGCKTADDPFASKMPTPSTTNCISNGNYNGGNITLNPGTYCGWHNFNNSTNVTFNPGVYIIKDGGWNVNGGNWTGTGVTFYFADTSKIQFNSAVKAVLKAPTSGTYQGILFFEKAGLSKSDFIFNDSRGQDFTGLIYLPSRNVTYNSASAVSSEQITMVFNTLILNQTTWSLEPGIDAIPAAGSTPTTTTAGPAYLMQ